MHGQAQTHHYTQDLRQIKHILTWHTHTHTYTHYCLENQTRSIVED